MTAAEVLLQAIGAGLTVSLEGDRLAVRPVGQLTDGLRQALVEQRQAIVAELVARASMPALVAPIPPRPCTGCAWLQADVFCTHYQANILEPARPCRCVKFTQREPALPW